MNVLVAAILVLTAYVGILSATTLLSQPFRVRAQDIGMDLLESPTLSKVERDEVSWMIESGTSSAIGLMLPFAAVFLLVGMLLGADLKDDVATPHLNKDRRFGEMTRYYVLSIMACSPFASLLAMPLIVILVGAVALRGHRGLIDAAEAPAMKAAAHFQPARA
ncbi:hypothetical protein VH567_15490 [Sphingomonas sp. 4RDLI-65]|uniref:hypothetical protein n=1 Tax=Sphingomonas sp. 4RDLI-65 TaxID=3111641 RepID=UPI003C26C928